MIQRLFFFVATLLVSSCSQIPDIVSPPISQNPAVIQLVDEAQEYSQLSQFAMAEAKLERALRLEPKNAALWFELAFINKDQGDLIAARSMALRAKSYSTSTNLTRNIDLFIDEL